MVRVDQSQVERFAEFFESARDVKAFDFCHTGEVPVYPPAGAPGVLEYFFFNAAHQFGFWRLEGDRYAGPMVATVEGRALKGSDYVSFCLTRLWRADPGAFAPSRVAGTDWRRVWADDSGDCPLPMWEAHAEIIRRYAEWFVPHPTSPAEILAAIHAEPRSLAAFLERAGKIPGYREDPLRKKLLLLAIMLENRPERFLRVTDPESYEPIIDYHLQRSALRTGLVRVDEPSLRERLVARRKVEASEERTLRRATFDAVRALVLRSGRSVAEIDYFFFMNQTRCPEMSEPQCGICPVNSCCARETSLFQPVFRTTAY